MRPSFFFQSSVLSLYTAALLTLSGNQSLTSLGVCVRAVSGHVTPHHLAALERKWCLRGTNAMLFVVTVPENDEEDEVLLKKLVLIRLVLHMYMGGSH